MPQTFNEFLKTDVFKTFEKELKELAPQIRIKVCSHLKSIAQSDAWETRDRNKKHFLRQVDGTPGIKMGENGSGFEAQGSFFYVSGLKTGVSVTLPGKKKRDFKVNFKKATPKSVIVQKTKDNLKILATEDVVEG